MAFDLLSIEEFMAQKCETKYKIREATLKTFEDYPKDNIKLIEILYKGNNVDEILGLLEEYKSKGAEGLMANLENGIYEFKRSKNILKLKTMQTADVKVVDYEEGTGKNKGKLGALIVEFIHNDNTYRCRVGSGFSDEERTLYWNDIYLVMNKIVEVQYFEITSNSNGEYGLRFPVWLSRIRDKTEISMY